MLSFDIYLICLVCRPCYKQLDTVGSRQDKFLYCAGSGHWLVGGELGAEAGGLLLNTSQVIVITIVNNVSYFVTNERRDKCDTSI